MANEIQIFSNPQFGEVRVALDGMGNPMFCLADVCKALELTNPTTVKNRLDKDDVQLVDLHALNFAEGMIGNSTANFITESGFYDVILQSSSPRVKPFRKWVTSELLPSVRKHGAYMTQDVIERTLQDPDYLIQLATTLKEEKQKRIEAESVAAKRGLIIAEQQKELTEAAPKVEYHDKVLSSHGYLTVNMIAASIGISDRKLNKLLCEWGVQYKESGSYQLYAPYRGKGYAKQIPYPYRDSLNQIRTKQHLYWTETGKKFIIELYEKKLA